MDTPTSRELREAIVRALTQLGEATASRIAVWLRKTDPSARYERTRIEQVLEEDGHVFMPNVGLLWGIGPIRWRLRSVAPASAGIDRH
jgi:hypothetical protein